MHELRRSIRVEFEGSEHRRLAGILDQPIDEPRGFLLFAHCFTCNKDLKAIVRISRRLAEHGWGVLRFDFSGLGNSQGDFFQTNFSTNRIDLRAAIHFLTQHYQGPTALIGHSFGGAASLSIAEEFAQVRGVVALAAPSDTSHLADLLERMDPNIRTQGTGHVTIGGRGYRIDRQMTEDFRSYDLPSFLSQLTKPVLVFHSLIDETLGYHHALRIFSLITQRADGMPPSPGASIVTLPEADHLFAKNGKDLAMVSDVIDRWAKWLQAKNHAPETESGESASS